ncbi:hypothetical protein CEXT_771031 [Caerostris extrusa]|uniref:Uncharacterized protein n=1 Tax=Caerostris extrusa TaxID=172846 RepID=A0AAV4PQX3_CAEEX|nr:hypothetical protein CEXT_771031 [Caerostris extrusa]
MLRVSGDAHFLGESRAIRDLPASPESVPLSIVGEGRSRKRSLLSRGSLPGQQVTHSVTRRARRDLLTTESVVRFWL